MKLNINFIGVLLLLVRCNDAGNYTITAPRSLVPGQTYNALVLLQGVTSESEIFCKLRSYTSDLLNNDKLIEIKNSLTLNATNNFGLCSLDIDNNLTNGTHEITIEGTKGISFYETIPLSFRSYEFVIVLQTDKNVYKSGENVMFRAIILTQSLTPADDALLKDVEIYIIDPMNNKLASFSVSRNTNLDLINVEKLKITDGVSDDTVFTLNINALKGNWTIEVKVLNQVESVQFIVVDNVSPPIAKTILDIPESIHFSQNLINTLVKCSYKFGIPVTGLLSIDITNHKPCGESEKNFTLNFSKILFDGTLNYSIDITNFLNQQCANKILKFTVTVYDNKTGDTYVSEDFLTIYNKTIFVEHEKPKRFFSGQIFESKSIIKKSQNNSVLDPNFFSCKAFITSETNVTKATRLFEISIIESIVYCRFFTDYDTKIITSELYYKSDLIDKLSAAATKSCENSFIQIFKTDYTIASKVDESILLIITSTESLHKIILNTVVRGIIIKSDLIEFDTTNTRQEIHKTISIEMLPEVSFVVYASSKSDNLISDAVTLKVSSVLNKNVNIFNNNNVNYEMGETINLTITSNFFSKVFLFTEEQSSFPDKNNDFLQTQFISKFNNFNSQNAQNFLSNDMVYVSNGDRQCKSEFYFIDDTEQTNLAATHRNSNYKETWLWNSFHTNSGSIQLSASLPVYIANWKLRAFAISKLDGLGFMAMPLQIRVSNPYILELHSISKTKINEKTELNISLFSYTDVTSAVQLTVLSANVSHIKIENCSQSFSIVPSGLKHIVCSVTPLATGVFQIRATAKISYNNDSITLEDTAQVLSQFEGIEVTDEEPVIFNLDESGAQQDEVSFMPSVGFLDQSLKVYVTARPLSIPKKWSENLKNLIKVFKINPNFDFTDGSCHDRSTILFPIVYMLDYLNVTKQISTYDQRSATQTIKKYINMLCYRNPYDGSLASFTYSNADNSSTVQTSEPSSVWQTANTIKLFYYAKKYTEIDDKLINNAIHWINKIQGTDGGFQETGSSNNYTTASPLVYQTSFVYIALDLHKMANQEAVDYLEKIFISILNSLDSLDITISCYVLHLANSPLKEKCYNKVLEISITDNAKRYWQGTYSKVSAAYALMIFTLRRSHTKGIEVLNYFILSNLFDLNGYIENTHTTAIVMEAISKFISMQTVDRFNDVIKFDYFIKNNNSATLYVTPKYSSLQTKEITNSTLKVIVKASGYGMAVASVVWKYHVKEINGLTVDVDNEIGKTNNGLIFMNFCNKYKLSGTSANVVTEIDLPSGYTYANFIADANDYSYSVERVDVQNNGTHLDIFIKELKKERLCLKVATAQTVKVINAKPGSIITYNRDLSDVANNQYKLKVF